jgi:hypothetical protein
VSKPTPPDFDLERAVANALYRGLDDWLMAYDTAWAAHVGGASNIPAKKEGALAVVESLLKRGYAVAGDVSASGFTPWEGSVEEVLHRTTALWPDDDDPGLGLFWLALTEAGTAAAEAVKARYDVDLLDHPNKAE